jgi:tRNA pseudouridine38-40 synthase
MQHLRDAALHRFYYFCLKIYPMPYRYFLKLAYDGTNYCGWQIQPNGNTVQAELTSALSLSFGEAIMLVGAGRTDTGVHAREMYAHFDLTKELSRKDILQALFNLNNMLPRDIAVQDVIPVDEAAHARFDATSRTYEYHILTRKDPFRERFCWYWQGSIDVEMMNKAAAMLIGLHDYQCFSKVKTDVNNYLCDVKEAFWQELDGELVFTITANRFLRNMVRAVVGTLFEIGRGKLAVADLEEIVASRNRSRAGASVPARGLSLVRVSYPFIP